MLHIVGINKDFSVHKAKRELAADRLVRIAKGIYCDKSDTENFPAFMKKNAIRIANHLYPDTVLIDSSAYYKGAVLSNDENKGEPSYLLFLASAYSKAINFPHLKIVQRKAFLPDKVNQYCQPYSDGKENDLGDMSLAIAVDELIFLQSFGKKSGDYPERFLKTEPLEDICAALEAKHGSDIKSRLRSIAKTIGDMDVEIKNALKMIDDRIEAKENEGDLIHNLYEFTVGWYKRPIAKIAYDGVTWKFNYDTGWVLPLSKEEHRPGLFPAFITNMTPQGYLLSAINDSMQNAKTKATVFSSSERYLCNLSIVEDAARVPTIPYDYLEGKLQDYTTNQGVFSGDLQGIPKLDDNFVREVRSFVARKTMPRLSGYQAKIPMNLNEEGVLTPAEFISFTHILKLPGIEMDKDFSRGAVEWASMDLARSGGVSTCEFSLVKLDDGSLAYLAERFDIPKDKNDLSMIFNEDFVSAMGFGPFAAGMCQDTDTSDILRAASSNFKEDSEELLRQFSATVLLENGDLHLKNLSIIKVANPNLNGFRSVRLAPAYDIMNTKFFGHNLKTMESIESMTTPINSKTEDITVEDLVIFASKMDISQEKANEIVFETAKGIANRAKQLIGDIPDVIQAIPAVNAIIVSVFERAVSRCHLMFSEIDPEISVDISKSNQRNSKRNKPS
jgi:serine/threonine-protein kinase HipA